MAPNTPPRRELTRNQTLVLGALAKASGPLSAYTLLDQLRAQGLRAPQQIYRALEQLCGFSLVHRIESLNAFVACGHRHSGDAPVTFAICDDCGDVAEFCDTQLGHHLTGWCDRNAFAPRSAIVELHGQCRDCSKS
ncbi:MAG: Fur family transcriptional regulator [Alphaproteobacteria bacterium]